MIKETIKILSGGADARSLTPLQEGDRRALEGTLGSLRRRYGSLSLTLAVCVGGLLILSGYRAPGKGLILGTLFSIANFILMSGGMLRRVAQAGSGKPVLSFGAMALRYALLAIPLALAMRLEQFSVLTAAVGLFMVQIAIVGDHLWGLMRTRKEVRN